MLVPAYFRGILSTLPRILRIQRTHLGHEQALQIWGPLAYSFFLHYFSTFALSYIFSALSLAKQEIDRYTRAQERQKPWFTRIWLKSSFKAKTNTRQKWPKQNVMPALW